MNWFEAITLGVVQGLTEFLPVSSSAHVSIVGQLISDSDPGAAFTAITQLGTEAAVLIYFRKDIARIVAAWCKAWTKRGSWKDPDAKMGWLVILGSLPIVVLGLLFQHQIEDSLRNLWITAAMLAIFALVLAWADKVASNAKPLSKLTWRDGFGYGFAQALALVPGVSRSGGTIAAGLLMGYTREAAARYSFLLAIPAVVGAGALQTYKALTDPAEQSVAWGPTIAATLVSFGIGYAVIAWLLKFVSTHTFRPFVYYRLAVAAILALLLAFNVIEP